MVNKKYFEMERISLITTMKCNLNCKLCISDIPYRKNEKIFSIENQKQVISNFFNIVTFVKKFTITGGEPLLYNELPQLVQFIQKFMGGVGILEIVTNSTIIPSFDLVNIINNFDDKDKNKIYFLLDNYGNKLSYNIKNVIDILNKNNINYIIRDNTYTNSYCNGWISYGDPSLENRKNKETAIELFKKCAQPQQYKFCFNTYNGIMYPCEQIRKGLLFGVLKDNYNEYINLLDTKLTIEEQRNKIFKIYNTNVLSACSFCNGMCDNSKRFPPAEQLTLEELQYIKKGARSYEEVCKFKAKKDLIN